MVPLDIFGDAYAALIATPKVESEEQTTTNAAIDTQHSHLQISDVYTIGTAIKDKPMDTTQIVTLDPLCKLHGSNANTNVDTLQEATTWRSITSVGNCSMSPVLSELLLLEATSIHTESLQEPTLLSVNNYLNTAEASYMASQLPELTLPEATSLQEATSTTTSSPDKAFKEAPDKNIREIPPLLNIVSSTASIPGPPIAMSPIVPDLDYHEPSISANLIPTKEEPPKHVSTRTLPCLNNIGSKQELTATKQPNNLCSNFPAVKTDVYYSILTVEQDNIIYLHHKDIVNHTCIVKVEKLSQSDVPLAHAAIHDSAPSLELPACEPIIKNIDIDPDWPVKKHKKKSTQPGPRPSTQCIAAQCIIEESNRWKKRKDYVPTQILRTLPEATLPKATSTELPTTPRTVASQELAENINIGSVPLQEATSRQHEPMLLPEATSSLQMPINVENLDSTSVQHEGSVSSNQNQDLEDSDTTVIYNLDDVVPDKKKRVFTTVTRGIKITKRSCMYTCPKCGIKKTSVQSINEHYKCRHDSVKCKK